MTGSTFYFDLGSPYAYLTAERISGLFTDAGLEQPEWQPVLLGAHIVGNRACDMIAELVATMALEGGYQELSRIVHPHPTVSETILDAARAVDGWAIHA